MSNDPNLTWIATYFSYKEVKSLIVTLIIKLLTGGIFSPSVFVLFYCQFHIFLSFSFTLTATSAFPTAPLSLSFSLSPHLSSNHSSWPLSGKGAPNEVPLDLCMYA